MTTNRQRLIGVALTTIGFALAAMAGLGLASQAAALGTQGLLTGGLLAFVLVIPFLGGGIYFYARSGRDADEPESTLPQQVLLSDRMKARPTATLDELSAELGASPQEVLDMVHDLARLKLFSGYLTPEGQLHRIEAVVIQQMNRCQRCGNPVQMQDAITVCTSCGTEYYTG